MTQDAHAITYCANGCTRASNGERIPVTTTPPSLLCDRCEDNLRRALKEIPARYRQLPTFIDNGSTPKDPDQKPTKRTDAPAPMRLEIVDLLDTRLGRKWQGLAPSDDRRGVLGTVHAWAQLIRTEKTLTALTSKPTVRGEITIIERWLNWSCEQDWIADMLDELRTLNNMLGNAIGEHRPKPVGVCIVDVDDQQCGGPLLPSRTGGVYCPRCGDTWDIDELRRLGLLLGEQEPA